MKDPRNILAGVAFRAGSAEISEGSAKAARQAAWIAGVNGGRLVLLHSTHDEREDGGEDRELSGEERAALESFAAELAREGTPCELAVIEDKAWRAITRRVLAGGADLVVVGKRNDRGGEGPRLGSVSSKLVRNCPGPVWCVRPEHDLAMRLVLAASDLSAVGDRVCRAAEWIAERHGCELHLLHAYAPPAESDGAELLPGERRAEKAAAIRDRARRKLQGSASGRPESLRVVTHVVKGRASARVREAVEHLGPDLLVLGVTSRREPGHLIGDLADRVLARVGCSLLTLKPDDFVSPLAT